MGDNSSSPRTPSSTEASESSHKDVSHPVLSATLNCTFSIGTASDEENGEINRMISIPDDRIFVVDISNSCLKLYSNNYVLHDTVKLMCCYAVTYLDDNNAVAVATVGPTGSDVIYYSLEGNKITETAKGIHIDGIINDLAYRHGECIIRYQKDNQDFTYCGSKRIIKQERKGLRTDFMHYDAENDFVLIGNYQESTVACYKPNGKVIWRVAIDGLPAGITVVQGVILVADFYDNVIRQITMDGRLLATPFLTEEDGLTKPNAITYQQQNQRLLVNKYKDDTVMAFDVSGTR